MTNPISAWSLAGLLTFTGMVHLVRPRVFTGIVPSVLPKPRFWVLVSGLAELGVAALIAVPRTRRLGGWSAAALFVAVFPANVQMALDAQTTPERCVAYARLPLQAPLIWWALRVTQRRGRR